MNITNVYATRIGSHAKRYLSLRSRTGIVASRFAYGFNILFDEDYNPGFVSFQLAESPLHPWAVETESLLKPRIGSPANVDADHVQVGDKLSIDICGAEVCELHIQPWRQDEASLAQLRVPMVKDLFSMERDQRCTGPLSQMLEEHLIQLTGKSYAEQMNELVGSGLGSTPSGDDFIVGILAVWWAIRTFSSRAERQIAGFRALFRWEELSERTPLPSAQMILAATDGCFPETIRAFLVKMTGEYGEAVSGPAHALASLGATSGVQMLSGILEALRTLDL